MSAVHDTRSNRSQLRSCWAWLSWASFGGSKTFVIAVEASCGCPKYTNDVYMNIHNPNPNPNPNPKSLTPP